MARSVPGVASAASVCVSTGLLGAAGDGVAPDGAVVPLAGGVAGRCSGTACSCGGGSAMAGAEIDRKASAIAPRPRFIREDFIIASSCRYCAGRELAPLGPRLVLRGLGPLHFSSFRHLYGAPLAVPPIDTHLVLVHSRGRPAGPPGSAQHR